MAIYDQSFLSWPYYYDLKNNDCDCFCQVQYAEYLVNVTDNIELSSITIQLKEEKDPKVWYIALAKCNNHDKDTPFFLLVVRVAMTLLAMLIAKGLYILLDKILLLLPYCSFYFCIYHSLCIISYGEIQHLLITYTMHGLDVVSV